MSRPDVWLRGPVARIPPSLQPVAHALLQTAEDAAQATRDLSHEQLWQRVGGTASVGFHLRHIAGSTDRLFTYSRSEQLSADQRAKLEAESSLESRERAAELLERLRSVVDASLEHLRVVDVAALDQRIGIGGASLPSTPRGALSHAAEHAQRHAGQAITTAKMIRSGIS